MKLQTGEINLNCHHSASGTVLSLSITQYQCLGVSPMRVSDLLVLISLANALIFSVVATTY